MEMDNGENVSCSYSFLNLPIEMLQFITDYLNVNDIKSLSETCQYFYTLFNDDNFWIHRIRRQFPSSTAQFYTCDLFKKPDLISAHNEIRSSGIKNVRTNDQLELLAIASATHYNDEAIERRRSKMYVSKEDFLNNVRFYQFKQPNYCLKIPFMKVVYFYLTDRKRCAIVNMDVVHRNNTYLIEDDDPDSLTGRIIRLRSVCWLEINGRFEHKIMPGKYEVSWRMKCDSNGVDIADVTEFIVVPQYGRLLNYKISENDFRTLFMEHGTDHWFDVKMGHILIYEPSTVIVGIRNWQDLSWKRGLLWDCIELTIAP